VRVLAPFPTKKTLEFPPLPVHNTLSMNMQSTSPAGVPDLNRRDFLRHSSAATLVAAAAGGVLTARQAGAADAAAPDKKPNAPVNIGVIGCGYWGRDVVKTLGQLVNAKVLGVAEHYEAFLRRAKDAAPGAEGYEDYRKLLENKDIKAVVIATPTHEHKQVVLDALQAGKHVYCEAPLANTIDDARAIAKAAQDHSAQVFHPGLQHRSDPQRHFLLKFIRSGATGRMFKGRSQWHKKESWRRTSPNPERERELNWRLRKDVSLGLVGEIGIQHLDNAGWFLKAEPIAISGYGSTQLWNDGREVPDTLQATVEYSERILVNFEASLATSFDSDYETYYGTDSTVMVRKNKAWMFREADAPLLGWEVYARKDAFYGELGIALVANATKLAAQGEKPAEEAPYSNTPLYFALEAFLHNVHTISDGVTDFTDNFDATDKQALKEYLGSLSKSLMPAATIAEGFRATVLAIKANEAVMGQKRIELPSQIFAI
jgi:predicted dehydrogenase